MNGSPFVPWTSAHWQCFLKMRALFFSYLCFYMSRQGLRVWVAADMLCLGVKFSAKCSSYELYKKSILLEVNASSSVACNCMTLLQSVPWLIFEYCTSNKDRPMNIQEPNYQLNNYRCYWLDFSSHGVQSGWLLIRSLLLQTSKVNGCC